MGEHYKESADQIYADVRSRKNIEEVLLHGVNLKIFPGVYPPQQFRSTLFALDNIAPLTKGKTVCEIGCGTGVLGLYCLNQGASYVIMSDINPVAALNAKENKKLNSWDAEHLSVYQGDCFENVPKQIFDIIVWLMPYHSDEIQIKDPLQQAFYDPGFKSLKKFLSEARHYSSPNTNVFIGFSNKGNIEMFELILADNSSSWELWRLINSDQLYDNRIYRIKLKK